MPDNAPDNEGAAEVISPAPLIPSKPAPIEEGAGRPSAEAREEQTAASPTNGGSHAEHDEAHDEEARKAAKKAAKEARKAAKREEKERARANELAAAAVAKKASDQAVSDEEEAHKSVRLRFESPMDREELAAYLEAIVKGLRKGSILFRQAETSLTLSPSPRVDVEVKVASKKGREKLEIEIEWSGDDPQELTIVAG